MFSGKDLKVKLVYMGFGGMIAVIGMLPSVTAQNEKFVTIECSKFEVVNEVIKQTLNDFNAYAVKAYSIEKSEPWTRGIKNRICKIGKERGYEVRASSSEEADSGEWLYDVIWRKMSENKVLDVGLVLESEWKRPLIDDDFQKLLLAKAELRCMIFYAASKQSAKREVEELINQVVEFSRSQTGDKYLFCGWLVDEERFYFRDYTYAEAAKF